MPAAVPIRTDHSPHELRRLARRERDGRVGTRLLGVASALNGLPRGEAARLAGLDIKALQRWIERFNRGGPKGLRDRPRPGRPCALDEGRQAALRALILHGPDPKRDGYRKWRIADLCRAVEERFGVTYAETGMLRLVKGLGLSWQRAWPPASRGEPLRAGPVQGGLPGIMARTATAHPEAGRAPPRARRDRLARPTPPTRSCGRPILTTKRSTSPAAGQHPVPVEANSGVTPAAIAALRRVKEGELLWPIELLGRALRLVSVHLCPESRIRYIGNRLIL